MIKAHNVQAAMDLTPIKKAAFGIVTNVKKKDGSPVKCEILVDTK